MPRKYVKPPEGFEEFQALPNDKKRDKLKEDAAALAYWHARELKQDQARIQKKYTPLETFNHTKSFGVLYDKVDKGDQSGFTLRLPAEICEGWMKSLPMTKPLLPVEEGKPTEEEKKEEVLIKNLNPEEEKNLVS